jgi:hypothetical protein
LISVSKNKILLRQNFWNSIMEITIEKKRKSLSHQKTTSLPDKVLIDFISDRNNKSLKDLRGKISFRDDYDYKSMRR